MSDEPTTCCDMRRKVTVFLGPVLPEEVCGVPDTLLADFMRFDLPDAQAPDGTTKPVLGFRYCPWCGKPFTSSSETRTTMLFGHKVEDGDESGEEWKKLKEDDDE
jgi:hypothetical protein